MPILPGDLLFLGLAVTYDLFCLPHWSIHPLISIHSNFHNMICEEEIDWNVLFVVSIQYQIIGHNVFGVMHQKLWHHGAGRDPQNHSWRSWILFRSTRICNCLIILSTFESHPVTSLYKIACKQRSNRREWNWRINRMLANTYLIFVIFFTLAKFLENNIYTEKRQFFALNL